MINLREIKERSDRATKGPWVAESCFGDWNFPYAFQINRPDCVDDETVQIVGGKISCLGSSLKNQSQCKRTANDSDFIAHSRTDLPALLQAVEEARTIIRLSIPHWTHDNQSYCEMREKWLAQFEGGE